MLRIRCWFYKWSQILPSLMRMYVELCSLDFRNQDYKIVLIKPTAEPNDYHGKYNLCVTGKELIGFLVVFGCVVNNYAIAVPQNEFFNACLKRQTTARRTVRLTSVGKIPFFINSHKVKCRALKLARIPFACVKYCSPFSMNTARLIVFRFNGEVILVVTGAIIFIIQSRAIVALANNQVVFNYYRSAFSPMARSILSNFCRHAKEPFCFDELFIRYQLHVTSIRHELDSYKVSHIRRLEPNLKMKILRQMICGTYRAYRQDKNPTSRRVLILVRFYELTRTYFQQNV